MARLSNLRTCACTHTHTHTAFTHTHTHTHTQRSHTASFTYHRGPVVVRDGQRVIGLDQEIVVDTCVALSVHT